MGLLLGTTPQARIGRITNQFFIYRIDAAEQLYKAGKIDQILISGDENSLDGVNETECMRDSLVARGVPASDQGNRPCDLLGIASPLIWGHWVTFTTLLRDGQSGYYSGSWRYRRLSN